MASGSIFEGFVGCSSYVMIILWILDYWFEQNKPSEATKFS